MKFAMAYSMGKDCTLALEKMIKAGHEPVCMIVISGKTGLSFNHLATEKMAQRYSETLGIPLIYGRWEKKYDSDVVRELMIKAREEYGAEAACFGYIDLMREWSEQLCREEGLECFTPLWQTDHETCLKEQLDGGYKCLITSIDKRMSSMPVELLGKTLDWDVIEQIRQSGADICGENGEYHTLVTDCPLFKHPLEFKGFAINLDKIAFLVLR